MYIVGKKSFFNILKYDILIIGDIMIEEIDNNKIDERKNIEYLKIILEKLRNDKDLIGTYMHAAASFAPISRNDKIKLVGKIEEALKAEHELRISKLARDMKSIVGKSYDKSKGIDITALREFANENLNNTKERKEYVLFSNYKNPSDLVSRISGLHEFGIISPSFFCDDLISILEEIKNIEKMIKEEEKRIEKNKNNKLIEPKSDLLSDVKFKKQKKTLENFYGDPIELGYLSEIDVILDKIKHHIQLEDYELEVLRKNEKYGILDWEKNEINRGIELQELLGKKDNPLEEMMRIAILTEQLTTDYLLARDLKRENQAIKGLNFNTTLEDYISKYKNFMNKYNKMNEKKQQELVSEYNGVKPSHDALFGEIPVEPGLADPETVRIKINSVIHNEIVNNRGLYTPSKTSDLEHCDIAVATKYMEPEEILSLYNALKIRREEDSKYEEPTPEKIENKREYLEKLQRDFVELLYIRTKEVKTGSILSEKEKNELYAVIIERVMKEEILLPELNKVDISNKKDNPEDMFLETKKARAFENVNKWDNLLENIRGKKDGRKL